MVNFPECQNCRNKLGLMFLFRGLVEPEEFICESCGKNGQKMKSEYG